MSSLCCFISSRRCANLFPVFTCSISSERELKGLKRLREGRSVGTLIDLNSTTRCRSCPIDRKAIIEVTDVASPLVGCRLFALDIDPRLMHEDYTVGSSLFLFLEQYNAEQIVSTFNSEPSSASETFP